MCDACVNQVLGLECGLERAHEDAVVNFEQRDLLDCHRAINITRTHGHVGETATHDVCLFGGLVLCAVFEKSVPEFLVVNWLTTGSVDQLLSFRHFKFIT